MLLSIILQVHVVAQLCTMNRKPEDEDENEVLM